MNAHHCVSNNENYKETIETMTRNHMSNDENNYLRKTNLSDSKKKKKTH